MKRVIVYLLTLCVCTLALLGCSLINTLDDYTLYDEDDTGNNDDPSLTPDDSSSEDDTGSDPDPAPDCIRYVDSQAGGGDGTTWETAFSTVQEALEALSDGNCQIWIAAGTYYVYETGPTDTLQLPRDIWLMGGFAGGESALDQRDLENNRTILDGTAGEGSADHVYTVVTGANGAHLDGLVIQKGDASGDDSILSYETGGGLFFEMCEMVIDNCEFRENYAVASGGAIKANNADLVVRNSRFAQNAANEDGGGISVSFRSLTLEDTVFEFNAAELGGGLYTFALDSFRDPESRIERCGFFDNTADGGGYGGGASVYSCQGLEVADTVFVDNEAINGASGGGLAIHSTQMNVSDCVFVGNSADGGGGGVNVQGEGESEFARCYWGDNTAADSGAGIRIKNDATPVITESVLSHNRVEFEESWRYGGAIAAIGGANATIQGSLLVGNSVVAASEYNGGAVGAVSQEGQASIIKLENNVLAGNSAGQGGGCHSSDYSVVTLLNNTFFDNNAALTGSAVFSTSNSTATMMNNLFTETGADVYWKDGAESPDTVQYNLFTEWTGRDGNLSGEATFVTPPTVGDGWDAVAYDETSFQTALTDHALSLDAGALQNRLIKPVASSGDWFPIADNTETVVYVWGDLTETVSVGDPYEFMDLHLSSRSLGVDDGTSVNAPTEDFDGNSRFDNPQMDNDGFGGGDGPDYYDIGAFEFVP